MTTTMIDIRDAAKHYPVFRRRTGGLRYLLAAIFHGRARIAPGVTVVRALEGLQLQIRKGERVGIIGRNGAGKSTLLKMLAGDFAPSLGTVQVHGEVYSLLPGTVSFSPELSAADNARNYLSLFDLKDDEIDSKISEIEAFTELGDYFHQPIRSYSLGMRVRTEFAVATSHSADVIVIDEVLGAGDIYWAEKIATRMNDLCEQGVTLLLVSHALDQITRFCDRIIWIERGRVVMDGPVVEVTRRYESFLERLSWHTDDTDDKTVDVQSILPELGNEELEDSGQTIVRWPGHGDVVWSGVWLNGNSCTELTVPATHDIEFRANIMAKRTGNYALRYLCTFWGSTGKRIAVIENHCDEASVVAHERREVTVKITGGQLAPGRYVVSLSLFSVPNADASVQEQMNRLDVLYKSFQITLTGEWTWPQPVYRIQVHSS